jgi:hypothetical protein
VQTALFLVFSVDLVAFLIVVLADVLVADGEASPSGEPNGTRSGLRMSREARQGSKTLSHRRRQGSKG